MLAGALLLAVAAAPSPASDSELALNPFGLGLEDGQAAALEAAIDAGGWRTAEAMLFRSAMSEPENPAIQRALGIAHYQAGRPYPAAAALKRADAMSPLDAETRYLLASAFLRLERRHWARAELEHLVQAHPHLERYRVALARVHYEDQRFEAGIEMLGAAPAENGRSAEAYDLAGQCLEGLGRSEEAVEAYRKAILVGTGQPAESPWPHFHLGSLLHDLGQLEPAEASLRSATRIDPGNAPALHELGLVLRKTGKLKASAEALEAASRLSPADATIVYSLASVYRQLGLRERSAALMDRFRGLRGSDGKAAGEGLRDR